jgi:hypothetical protein
MGPLLVVTPSILFLGGGRPCCPASCFNDPVATAQVSADRWRSRPASNFILIGAPAMSNLGTGWLWWQSANDPMRPFAQAIPAPVSGREALVLRLVAKRPVRCKRLLAARAPVVHGDRAVAERLR